MPVIDTSRKVSLHLYITILQQKLSTKGFGWHQSLAPKFKQYLRTFKGNNLNFNSVFPTVMYQRQFFLVFKFSINIQKNVCVEMIVSMWRNLSLSKRIHYIFFCSCLKRNPFYCTCYCHGVHASSTLSFAKQISGQNRVVFARKILLPLQRETFSGQREHVLQSSTEY